MQAAITVVMGFLGAFTGGLTSMFLFFAMTHAPSFPVLEMVGVGVFIVTFIAFGSALGYLIAKSDSKGDA